MFVVTGGGSGIGRALALSLAHRGYSVLIVGRRETMLQDTAAQSSLIQYLCVDVSTAQGLDVIEQFLDSYPKISGLINNAGTLGPIEALTEIQRDAWNQTLNTNVTAPLFLTQRLSKKLDQAKVLNIGSGAAYFPIQGWAAYCVSKAALSMLTRCWQLESKAVYVASVMPGITDTDMQHLARQSTQLHPDTLQFYRKLKETGRLISPDTVAEFLCWLLLSIDYETYVSKEWDIYDTAHHAHWLKPPHQVLHWDF